MDEYIFFALLPENNPILLRTIRRVIVVEACVNSYSVMMMVKDLRLDY